MVIYTLVGSLLMLAGAIALGVLATPEGGEISFSLADLQERTLGEGTQQWIFLLFAAAFLVKAPVFPLHGWMPDAYRAAPLPVLVVFSAVVSKVGVYGFLRIVLPVLPDASIHFQDVMLAFAVVSILYGSVIAFSQDDTRLVVGYSSIAQLGFILLGIFALDAEGRAGRGDADGQPRARRGRALLRDRGARAARRRLGARSRGWAGSRSARPRSPRCF